MKKILLSSLISLFTLSLILGLNFTSVYAQGGETDFVTSCPPDSVTEDCQPPTLQQFEFLAAQILYIAWGLGGFLWLGYFIYIASKYMRGNPQEIEDAKKRFGLWLGGIVLYYLSYVVIAQIMGFLIGGQGGNSDCFNQFDGTPGFTFFFPTVCT